MSIDDLAKRRAPKPPASDERRPRRIATPAAAGDEAEGTQSFGSLPGASHFAIDDEGHLLWSDPEAIAHLTSLDAVDHDGRRRGLNAAWTRRLWSQVLRKARSPQVCLIDPVATGGCTGTLFWSPDRPARLNALLIDGRASGIEIDPAWDAILSALQPIEDPPRRLLRAA